MTDIQIDLDILDALDGPLSAAAAGIEALASGVPTGVDAGVMTSVITAMLGEVVESAGNVSTILTASAELTDTAATYYRRADADAAASMADIQRAMGR